MTSFKTKITSVSIDSLFRQNYNSSSSSNFIYKLPSPIKNVIKMSISAIEIPNFWYQYSMSEKTNQFTITTYNYATIDPINPNNPPIIVPSKSYNIVIPDGNYNNVEMVILLMNYFKNIGEGLAYLIVSIDVNSGKTIFRARHPTDNRLMPSPYDPNTPYYSPLFYYTLDFRVDPYPERPIYKNIGWSLGFTQPIYTVSCSNTYTTNYLSIPKISQMTYNGYISSESAFGSSYYNYVFLDIDDNNSTFSNDGIISCLSNSYLSGNNIIARITITSAPNSINLTTSADCVFKTREYYGPVTIDMLNIRLLNRHGDIIPLNGNDFSFLIEFTILEI